MNLQSNKTDDIEIDLKLLFSVVWNAKLLVFLVTIISLTCGVYYLRQAVEKYSVVIVYKQVSDDTNRNPLGGFSGLASLAGVNLPSSSSSDFEAFMHLMSSEEVAKIIFQNSELMKKIFVSEFDEQSNTFKMQNTDFLGSSLKRIKSYVTGKDAKPYQAPNSRRLALILKKSFNASVNKKNGFLILSTETSKPDMLIELMENVILTADILIKNRYVKNFSESLNFYQEKIVRAKSREHREALAKLIVDEEKKLMLASRGKNFVVEPISKPQISFYPTSPNNIGVLMFSLIIGLFCGSVLALVINYFKKKGSA
ncbi:Wzz/FepE/Etk N-terminal domain-containing protein [Amylibacter sp.]|nr:Wzz/FepE/Etk N-terminal domain-containing protein [Amylibacter sp.]